MPKIHQFFLYLTIICACFIRKGYMQSDGFVYPNDPNENSLSEQKCIEYSKLITEELEFLPLIAGAEPSSINVTKCEYDKVALIIGGSPALLGEFPFMAAIGYRDGGDIKWFCGGTLVSERYVMTAAHCQQGIRFGAVVVRLGDLDLTRSDEGGTPEDYDMETFIIHPNYRHVLKYNDIALIKLARPVETFTKYIRPACLYNKFDIPQKTALATGWGRTEEGNPSSSLLKVPLNIFPLSQCQKTYAKNKGLPNGVIDTMLCAGDMNEKRDTCMGDSGGPLLFTKPENLCIFYIVGVTSFGKICGEPTIPAIYSRVSEYIPWIESTIW